MSKGAAFITGGSSGIGLEIAHLLAERGHAIALFSRNEDKLQDAVKAIHQRNSRAIVQTFAVDISDAEACLAAVQSATDQLGPPKWAVACAGIAEPGEFLDQSLATFETHMAVNYMGALYFAKAVAGPMTAAGGNLVFVSSGAAFFGIYGYSAYAPSKFAMRGLAEVLRIELAPKGISVTLAYPPDTDTPMLAAEGRTKPEITKNITAGGGLWSAPDVARLIVSRASDGKFTVAPGVQMKALLIFHSVLGPLLRFWQGRIVRSHLKR